MAIDSGAFGQLCRILQESSKKTNSTAAHSTTEQKEESLTSRVIRVVAEVFQQHLSDDKISTRSGLSKEAAQACFLLGC